ncbi:hypothetical protein [Nonomuraea sp. NPDC003709]|uniref:hypothetical protein n=1 Tax=Nonomuraea sp. NPDC003709 TaxID=3154450 RepID=UPI0033A8C6FF
MGDARCRYGFDQAEVYVLGQRLEEGAAAAGQDVHLVEDHLVDESPVVMRVCRSVISGALMVANPFWGSLKRLYDRSTPSSLRELQWVD